VPASNTDVRAPEARFASRSPSSRLPGLLRWIGAAAVLLVLAVAALVLVAFATLPPRPVALSAPADGTIPGLLHIHTRRSDGRGTPDQIAAAAARAGLKFVVFTDHGDGTRVPDPPTYRSGVLCLDGVEVSTTGGHYVALDMAPSPYPLGGEARDVVDDVRRLGGFGIAAHPDSPKPELQWREWTAPFDGIELLNPDTSWRRMVGEGSGGERRLLLALLHYPFRPAATIASIVRDSGVLPAWHSATARRRVVAIAGADAHAKLELRNTDPGDNRWTLPLPGYSSIFEAMSVHVRTGTPLTGDARTDASTLLRAIRSGHLYTALDGLATPPSFTFSASNSLGTVREGNELGVGGPVTLRVQTNAPPEFTTIVWSGGRVYSGDHHERDFSVQVPDGPAVYSVSILAPRRTGSMTWLQSNPIYVRGPEPLVQPIVRLPPTESQPVGPGWRIEHDGSSSAALEQQSERHAVEVEYRLGGGAPAGQSVALVFDTPSGIAAADRLSFTIRAEHPMRLSVQLRVPDPGSSGSQRWQRSVFAGPFDQDRSVFVDDLTPIGRTATWRPPLALVRSLMFVVDTVNTKPGSSGRFSITAAALQR